jgi:hypothetical protein
VTAETIGVAETIAGTTDVTTGATAADRQKATTDGDGSEGARSHCRGDRR